MTNFKQTLQSLTEGETKTATWSKKFKQLEYWTSRNTSGSVNAESKEQAKAIIKNSGIEQKLKIVK